MLQTEARGAKVASTAERRPETLSLVLGRDEDYRGLGLQLDWEYFGNLFLLLVVLM